MNTFTSCGLPWHPVPDDGKCPCPFDQTVRVLLLDEMEGVQEYEHDYDQASLFPWRLLIYAGWYPVNPDGTEIALLPSPKPLTRPRVLRRRFPLARGVRPTWK